ncbi:MAG: hypothetical protein ACOVMH_05335 [Flavobacterium sp.]
MRFFLKLISAFLIFISVESCSKDDNNEVVNPGLVGKWEYEKIGSINSSGEEVLASYVNACATKKDFVEFTQASFSDTSFGGGCETYTANYPSYSKNDNIVRFYTNGNTEASFYYEVLSLTETELKVKSIYTNVITGKASSITVIVFKRK